MSGDIFDTVLVSIATPKDAEETARAVHGYAHEDSEVIVTHIVEKGDESLDKASDEQQEQHAEEPYEMFVETFPDVWGHVQFVNLYGRNVAETSIEGASEAEATVIAFTPRGRSRWGRLLTGNVARTLVANSDFPVISLREQPTSTVIE